MAARPVLRLDVLSAGEVVPSDGVVPGGVPPVVGLDDLGRVLNGLTAEEAVVLVEEHAHRQTRVNSQ
jgi:hypothetical protein